MIITLDTPASYTCPKCLHWPIATWKHGEDAGTICNRCGWKKVDIRREPHEYRCACGRAQGDVWMFSSIPDKKAQQILRDRYRCAPCSALWISKGRNLRPWMNVRHEGRCMCGCGKLLVWQDFKENIALDWVTWRTGLWIDPDCMKAGREPRGIDIQMKKIWAAGGRSNVTVTASR
jgi:hypothetical protein